MNDVRVRRMFWVTTLALVAIAVAKGVMPAATAVPTVAFGIAALWLVDTIRRLPRALRAVWTVYLLWMVGVLAAVTAI